MNEGKSKKTLAFDSVLDYKTYRPSAAQNRLIAKRTGAVCIRGPCTLSTRITAL